MNKVDVTCKKLIGYGAYTVTNTSTYCTPITRRHLEKFGAVG